MTNIGRENLNLKTTYQYRKSSCA